ncbi:3'-5' exonuclease [Campylobacter coli]|nr:3'-5' exonuclease [Campylobacter coli]
MENYDIDIYGNPIKVKKPSREFKGQSLIYFPKSYVVIDLETTGFDPKCNEILEIVALRYENNEKIAEFSKLIKVSFLPSFITEFIGINEDMIKNCKDLNSEKFLKTIYWFKQIIKSDQEVSEEYKKGYFEKIDKIIQILIKEQYPYYSKRIKLLIAFSKQYKKFYSKITKKHNNEDKLKIFKYNIEEYSHIFHFVNIDKFNQYEIKSIKDAFYNDKYFLKNFIDFFRLVPKKNPIPKGDHNLNRYTDADSKEYEKIFKKNNLFLAFIEYINENKYKKQMLIKDRRVNNDNSNILSKLFYL